MTLNEYITVEEIMNSHNMVVKNKLTDLDFRLRLNNLSMEDYLIERVEGTLAVVDKVLELYPTMREKLNLTVKDSK